MIRLVEYVLLAIASGSAVLSLVLVAEAFRDLVVQGVTDGDAVTIAASSVRGESYRFLKALAFVYVAVSFVSSPVPDPLPVGTGERVTIFTLAAALVLVASVDAYVTKRRLLRR